MHLGKEVRVKRKKIGLAGLLLAMMIAAAGCGGRGGAAAGMQAQPVEQQDELELIEPDDADSYEGELQLIEPGDADPSEGELQLIEPQTEKDEAPESDIPEPESAESSENELQIIGSEDPENEVPDPAVAEAADHEGSENELQVTGTDQAENKAEEAAAQQEASAQQPVSGEAEAPEQNEPAIDEDGTYTSKDDVALYIRTYGKLPENFITKKEAQSLGWPGGSLEPYAPGKCIGGDYFGNYEGVLPKSKKIKYRECDIDTLGRRSRGAKRIIYSNDGKIYYTNDHYETFTLLYDDGKNRW